MPAFDPVRDAVLNSPIVTASPGLGSPQRTQAPRFPSPHPSPTLSRRATDLSVLLNSDPPGSMRSRPGPSNSPPVHPHSSQNSEGNVLQPSISKRKSGGTRLDPAPTSRAPHQDQPRPVVHSKRPTSSSGGMLSPLELSGGAPLPKPSPSPPILKGTPYQPSKRISPEKSILQPLSKKELDDMRSFRGKGTARLAKRPRGEEEEDNDPNGERPAKRQATDSDRVAAHYNARPEVGVVQRQESPIIGLKNFNNWIKSVMFTRFAHPRLAESQLTSTGRGPKLAGKVLELGIGKGGDINKWSRARIKELVGVDIAAVSVDQARARWQSLRSNRFDAQFAALDCYTESLTTAFMPEVFEIPFDVVSMQFCMHYAFEAEAKVRCMLSNVSTWLRPGGVFIGTIPNAEQLIDELNSQPPGKLDFGNSVYQIRFEDRDNRPLYGDKYHFYLKDAVDNVPEYIVHWDNFARFALPTHEKQLSYSAVTL
ncbi:mRNA capping enzyme-domain-containing protein [Flagelloscypha sp. PMI_526]|nr:mRNA capping enzyme-domain-containing protein [Flagelloscypha sp. PMI_526]